MRMLVVGSFYGYMPWFEQARAWSNGAVHVDAVVVTGDMLSVFDPRKKGSLMERCMRTWVINQNRPVYWSRGGYDYSAQEMADWGLKNLFLAGAHEQGGWRIARVVW